MIRRIFSELPSFKAMTFHPGLNLIVADKNPKASARHTRNRAGKSSFVEIINFALGADCKKESIFKAQEIVNFHFGLELDLDGKPITVMRSGKKPTVVYLPEGDTSDWPVRPDYEPESRARYMSNDHWKQLLGHLMFGLPVSDDREKGAPSFRSLFSYFARRDNGGGFSAFDKHSTKQQTGDQQVSLSYLLGLDWRISQRWQTVRDRERTLKELKKAVNDGTLKHVIGETAALRSRLALDEERLSRLKANLASFQLHTEYHNFESEANALRGRLSRHSDDNTVDRQLVVELEQSIQAEAAPAITELERLYREVGVLLPANVQRRFEDVRQFHDSIIRNRSLYLETEVQEARARLAHREHDARLASDRLEKVLGILNSHGALEHLNRLQSEMAQKEAVVMVLRQKYEMAERIDSTKNELDYERALLQQDLKRELKEQEGDLIKRAVLAFEECSKTLYEDAGILTIHETPDGPKLDISIHGKRSSGIKKMQVFCFDMMLTILCAERKLGPKILIHDSHIFDGVDPRQIGYALLVGARLAEKYGFQYIVTLNSNDLPESGPEGFDLKPYRVQVELTDEGETGGLFGIRFG